MEVTLPTTAPRDSDYALEPRTDTAKVRNLATSKIWPLQALSLAFEILPLPKFGSSRYCL